MTESDIQRAIQLACSNGDTRLFRNNVGLGWVGRIVSQTPDRIVLADYRPLHAGLCEGSSDLIGWTRGGVFTAIEVKAPRGRVSEAQQRFLDAVTRAGGRAGVARSVADAITIVAP